MMYFALNFKAKRLHRISLALASKLNRESADNKWNEPYQTLEKYEGFRF